MDFKGSRRFWRMVTCPPSRRCWWLQTWANVMVAEADKAGLVLMVLVRVKESRMSSCTERRKTRWGTESGILQSGQGWKVKLRIAAQIEGKSLGPRWSARRGAVAPRPVISTLGSLSRKE